MTKIIEETLNLPSMKEALEALNDNEGNLVPETEQLPEESFDEMKNALQNSKNLMEKLNQIEILAEHSKKMRHLAETAASRATDLFVMGMNVDPKHSGPIFEASKDYMRNAIDAENSIVEKILRQEKLVLDKKRLEAKIKAENGDEYTIDAQDTVVVANTNDIIQRILDSKKAETEPSLDK